MQTWSSFKGKWDVVMFNTG